MNKDRVLKFENFLNEADFKENPAATKEYLNSLNNRAKRKIEDLERKYGAEIPRFMSFVFKVKQMQAGKERKLEELANKAIMEEFGDILNDTTITFEIPDDKIKIQKQEDEEKCEKCSPPPETKKEIEDNKIINAIHKRKLLNMVAQGEALNAKKIFLNPVSKNGIMSIFGKSDGEEYLDLLTKITDIAMIYDWNMPADIQKEMWEKGDGFAGTSEIKWEFKPPKSVENPENGKEEEEYNEEEQEEYTAEIMVKGIDYAMLIHEAIKGIWGLINQVGMAHLSDNEIGKIFPNTDTFDDEIQDIKLARVSTEDIRNFLNTFRELSSLKNGRAYVWGKMVDNNVLTDKEFIEAIKLIWLSAPLYNTDGTYSDEEIETAKVSMDRIKPIISNIINDIIKELKEWDSNYALGDYADNDTVDNDTEDQEASGLSVDALLDKINKSGIESLTKEEIAFLDAQYK